MSESNDWPFDCKQISAANWQQIDAAPKIWCEMTAVAKTNEEWIKFFFLPKLDSKVPPEIAKLLEVARGSMIYGWYFYPLLTLGIDQCWRILETGVRVRCQQLGVPTKKVTKKGKEINTNFDENITALSGRSIILEKNKTRWNAVRSLRNSASHPERQSLYDLGQAQRILSLAVEILNDLFQ
ncbi:MAG TPA: hypothetical protein VGM58_06965 [Verrucomicrobiae bacterium]|jgi:hypothetical protein